MLKNLIRTSSRLPFHMQGFYRSRLILALEEPVKRGALIGVVTGLLIGFVPGILLLFIATGADYNLSGGEILSFMVVSMISIGIAGAIIGGIGGIIAGLFIQQVRALMNQTTTVTSLGRDPGSGPDSSVQPGMRPGTYHPAQPGGLTTAVALTDRANVLDSLGRYKEALDHYGQALAIDSQHVGAWYNKGRRLLALGHHVEALDCFDHAVTLDAQDADSWYVRGLTLEALGRFTDARENFQRAAERFNAALNVDSSAAIGWYSKGNTLAKLGQFQDAVICFDRALAIDSNNPEHWYCKGLALAAMADSTNRDEQIVIAVECFKKASQLGHAKAGEAAAHYRRNIVP